MGSTHAHICTKKYQQLSLHALLGIVGHIIQLWYSSGRTVTWVN